MTRKLFVLTGAVIVAILRTIGRALYQPDDGERVSTWSIRKRDARIFYLLLSGLWLVVAICRGAAVVRQRVAPGGGGAERPDAALTKRRLSCAGRPTLPGPPGSIGARMFQTRSEISWR